MIYIYLNMRVFDICWRIINFLCLIFILFHYFNCCLACQFFKFFNCSKFYLHNHMMIYLSKRNSKTFGLIRITSKLFCVRVCRAKLNIYICNCFQLGGARSCDANVFALDSALVAAIKEIYAQFRQVIG